MTLLYLKYYKGYLMRKVLLILMVMASLVASEKMVDNKIVDNKIVDIKKETKNKNNSIIIFTKNNKTHYILKEPLEDFVVSSK